MNKAVFKKVFIPVYTIVKSEKKCPVLITVRSVQSLSCVRLFATAWTEARQASLSFTISQSLLRLMSIELVMPSNHLILCHPLILLTSILPSIRVFSNESVLYIRHDWATFTSLHFHDIFTPEDAGEAADGEGGTGELEALPGPLWSPVCLLCWPAVVQNPGQAFSSWARGALPHTLNSSQACRIDWSPFGSWENYSFTRHKP